MNGVGLFRDVALGPGCAEGTFIPKCQWLPSAKLYFLFTLILAVGRFGSFPSVLFVLGSIAMTETFMWALWFSRQMRKRHHWPQAASESFCSEVTFCQF